MCRVGAPGSAARLGYGFSMANAPAGTIHELLWDASYFAAVETAMTAGHVWERAPGTPPSRLRRATMPEETTTSNLVRRLAYTGRDLGVVAVLHSRPLEGGVKRKGKVIHSPSGADLELALEVAPGRWVDLLLQAKNLKRKRKGAEYTSWQRTQNGHLRTWAAAHGRTPGMLLYNELVSPFVATTPPATVSDYQCVAFGACLGANQIQLHDFATTASRWDIFQGTPGGVSLCMAPRLLDTDAPRVADIVHSHFPLEHLAHLSGCSHAVSAGPESPDLTEPVPAVAELDTPIVRDGVPDWAVDLLEATRSSVDDAEGSDDEARDFHIGASVVVPLRDAL